MKLFIDGDAFPNLLKAIVLRAVEKQKIDTVVIANKKINIGTSNHIKYIIVDQGADEADDKIVELVETNDLVITADIPLADRTIAKNAHIGSIANDTSFAYTGNSTVNCFSTSCIVSTAGITT